MTKRNGADGGSLERRAAKAAGVGTAGTIAKLALQLGAQLILLRLVTPGDYGVFSIAVICMSFANFLSDAGLSAALVQRASITQEDIRCAFTLQTLLGASISIAIYLLAPTLAELFLKPDLEYALRILCLVSFMNAASSVSSRLLMRDLRYLALQKANLVGYVIGYWIVGISLAAAGLGFRALAYACLCQAAITSALSYASNPHSILPAFYRENISSLASFGVKAIATNVANWWNASVDKLFVGKFFTPAETGLYSVAYNLIYTPLMQVLGNLQSVLFSAASKMTSNEEGYRKSVIGSLVLSSLVFFPTFLGLSVAAESFVGVVLGEKWLPSSAILVLLAPSFAFTAVQGLLTPFLWGRGNVGREMGVQLTVAVLAFVVVLIAIGYGIIAVAAGALLVAFLRFVIVLTVVAKTFDIPWRSILNGLAPAMIAGLAVVTAGIFLNWLCSMLDLGSLARLAAIAVGSVGTLFVSFRIFSATLRPIIDPLLGSPMSRMLARKILGA